MAFRRFVIALLTVPLGACLFGTDSGGDYVTTFEITNWQWDHEPGYALYSSTSTNLVGCTVTQPDAVTISVRCTPTSTGTLDLSSQGCSVLSASAPGNILNHTSSYNQCGGRTVTNETITCTSTCRHSIVFNISNVSP